MHDVGSSCSAIGLLRDVFVPCVPLVGEQTTHSHNQLVWMGGFAFLKVT